jgi:peptidoglycan/xylan/chitin deacetylase (PgdA/CDA1 family)
LHLPLARFRRQLDLLQDVVEVAPLPALMNGGDGSRPRPRVAITFDDAYQGAVTLGVSELSARGLPATVFVTPSFLGGRSFWWDALARPGGLSPEVRAHAMEELRGQDDAIREWAKREGFPLNDPPSDCRAASMAELEAAAALPGISLGSHTWSHPNLARLAEAELDGELVRPLGWLRERFGTVLPWVAYPYGRWSAVVAGAAERAGYAGGLRVDGGWRRLGEGPPFAVPRLNVPAGISADGFRLRLAGLFCR